MEGKTYEEMSTTGLQNVEAIADYGDLEHGGETVIVFYGLETLGFGMDCDVLQITMKCGNSEFNRYIYPSRFIPSQVSQVRGITFEKGNLLVYGQQVEALPKQVVLEDLLMYLKSLKKPSTLVAHNSAFDVPRLIYLIQETFLLEDFKKVIAGFTDTLALFRKKLPERKGKGRFTLSELARDTLSLNTENAHNARYDVFLLEKLVTSHFDSNELRANSVTLEVVLILLKGWVKPLLLSSKERKEQ